MASVWERYTPEAERPGKRLHADKSWESCVKKEVDCFRFLYDFYWQNSRYLVIEIEDRPLVWRRESSRNYFWTVRNSDLFQFFNRMPE